MYISGSHLAICHLHSPDHPTSHPPSIASTEYPRISLHFRLDMGGE
ncbi:hypothetical protein BBKW_0237 [Bifidobacterium catenulatum subsp. kashiwanohense JCM 15439 = DSM 21854]|nr:hypothetical protein BBKW_0237 [Bifidobacterium catenulatum subsp. kashiwanohense JCM 15439 = DSM 21854]